MVLTWPECGYRRWSTWLSRQQHWSLRDIPRLQDSLQHAPLAALLLQNPQRRALQSRQQSSAPSKCIETEQSGAHRHARMDTPSLCKNSWNIQQHSHAVPVLRHLLGKYASGYEEGLLIGTEH